ncbi:hypothetical protein THII_3383 [Thioploca ingrica]|uniref:Fibronectin type-III domain-containing protein n=1 Tax=Thioploca ingrica TaxID=40754 RepID=A0A090AQ10_9GAMM|nr:hypothetical protein THII_3383 [Thioploca ingrica]
MPSVLAATDCTRTNSQNSRAECQALVNFYNSTDGEHWSDSPSNNWNVTNTPCTWAGITCNNGRVIKIDRKDKNLKGSIPDLSTLTELQYLDLSKNHLNGSIEIPNSLTQLRNLQLDHNQLTGAIPDLSHLEFLEVLYLGDNLLEEGTIPEWIKNLTRLRTLGLSNSQRIGTIPEWINSLATLKYLQLDHNQLTGSIPNLSYLIQLKWLFLNNNRLTGSIPDLSKSTTLEILSLESNNLSGSIPTSLSNLTNLTHLNLGYNRLIAQDETLLNFLNGKNPTWKQTQTVPPTDIKTKTLSKNSVEVSWTPILYTGDGGYYQVKYATIPNGSYTPTTSTTADKNATNYIVNELLPDTTYYFVIETYTPPHQLNQNELVSELSPPISANTTVTPLPTPLSSNPLNPDESTNKSSPPVSATTTLTPPPIPLSSNPLNPDESTSKSSSPVPATTTVTLPPTPLSSNPLNPDESTNKSSSPMPATTAVTPTLVPLSPTMNLTIAFGGDGHGQVTTNPSGLDCDSHEQKCSYSYETASWVELIATPAAYSEFTGWVGYQSDCDDGKLFMSDYRYCMAYFERLRFPLTVTIVGQGKVNSMPTGIECGTQCRYRFELNTQVTLMTTPDTHWQFKQWQGDCDAKGLVIMNKEKQCEAIFVTVSSDTSGVPLTPHSDTNFSIDPAIYSNIPNEGVPPLVVNPGFYNFDNLTVGNLSPAQVITVTNAGNTDLQLGQLTVSSNEFILAEACSNQILSAGNHCAATVSFQPQLAGVKTAYLAIPIDNPKQTTVTVVTLTGKGDIMTDPTRLTGNTSYLVGDDTISSPLLVTFMSPLAAAVTPAGVELNWEIAATNRNQIAEIHLWKAQAVKGNCPEDIHQYDPKTAVELANQPHLDYQGTNTTCYGLQVIEYNGDVTWYITQAR